MHRLAATTAATPIPASMVNWVSPEASTDPWAAGWLGSCAAAASYHTAIDHTNQTCQGILYNV